ncbi:hypothetical protein [Paracoccus sp. MC1862]|uniref:hypothetical protein n=1 Tax=Paracoccus sp. MC1862 TaxID=2760307 RepID=UPI001603F8EB|nr:hypothetical protein [Paracoccus sp. MC1862]MBB1497529.1 hypothetical protein [Paracoccus sp. MC1862]QQO46000.1 hypothetical protein JGR78_06895 [Paracoccus sp. MC1862]
MFYVPGWISLKEVVLGIRGIYREAEVVEFSDITDAEEKSPYLHHIKKSNRLVWHKLKEWANNDQLGVLMPNGFVVLASEALIQCPDTSIEMGACINLMDCTVGSATWGMERLDGCTDRYEQLETLEEKQVKYGAYLFCPVVVDEGAYGPLLTTLYGRDRPRREKLTINDIADEVIAIYHEGTVRPTRKWVRETYLPNEKYETFQAVWKEITARCPDLAQGGRPKKPEQNTTVNLK